MSEGSWSSQLVGQGVLPWPLGKATANNKFAQLLAAPPTGQPQKPFARRLGSPPLQVASSGTLKVAVDVSFTHPNAASAPALNLVLQTSTDGVVWVSHPTAVVAPGTHTLLLVIGPVAAGKVRLGLLASGSVQVPGAVVTVDNLMVAK